MAGRPPKKNRVGNGYGIIFPEGYLETMDLIAKREGISRKALLLKFCDEGIKKHKADNYQTLYTSYAEGGSMNEASTEAWVRTQIRQLFLSRKTDEINMLEITTIIRGAGVTGKPMVQMGKRIASYFSGLEYKVWR